MPSKLVPDIAFDKIIKQTIKDSNSKDHNNLVCINNSTEVAIALLQINRNEE